MNSWKIAASFERDAPGQGSNKDSMRSELCVNYRVSSKNARSIAERDMVFKSYLGITKYTFLRFDLKDSLFSVVKKRCLYKLFLKIFKL